MATKKPASSKPTAKKSSSSKGSRSRTTQKGRSTPTRTAKRAATRKKCPTWRDYLTTNATPGRSKGWVAIRWIEANCVHTNDRWQGRPFKLLAWQKFVVLALFAVGDDGIRLIRWALIGVAKKNGKTELCAALALFFAFGPSGPGDKPEPSALVVCAAGNDDQADLVFGAAKTMAELSPTLSQTLETYEAEILCSSLRGSKIIRVSAAAKRTSSNLDGKNVYVVICDELHCWEGNHGRVVWETLTNATVTRRQPLVLQVTTAFFDEDTVCAEQYAYGQSVASGKLADPAYFFWWVQAPDGSDHRDPDVIKAANPSFGAIMELGFYLDQLTKKTEAVFRRFYLNQPTDAEETWLEHGTWEKLKVAGFEMDPEAATFVAIDAATKHDSTAVVEAQWNPTSGRLRMRARIWERPMDPRTRRPVEGWKLPTPEVEDHLRQLRTTYGEHLATVGYDPAHFHRSAEQLETEGLPVEEFPQGDARMVPASQTLFQLVLEGQIEHDGDPDFARHLRNAVAVQARGGNGGWRLAKGKARKKMDAAVAAAMVSLLASQPVEAPERQSPLVMTIGGNE